MAIKMVRFCEREHVTMTAAAATDDDDNPSLSIHSAIFQGYDDD